MEYRKEIDGLRAVAVLPVMLFHAGIDVVSGGFLGVDVFFVISGFLITTIILTELARGEFSLLNFYERRARRILPALLVMVILCIPLAWNLMFPDPLENFGQSVIATVLSLNNVLLAITSGYWDLAAEFKPLLHTWSLAVEEQYYLIFPVILLLFYPTLKTRTIHVVWGIVIASFASSVVFFEIYPKSTFYLFHSRAWELGAGSLIAYWDLQRRRKPNDFLAGLGFLAILLSMMLFDKDSPHPSYMTLAPVAGTMLVILYAKQGTLVAGLLGFRVLVGIGLISYSLYLWHQPLFAFTRIISFEQPPAGIFLGLIGATFVLAFLSWKFVELPFRRKSSVSTRTLVTACITATGLLGAGGLAFHFGHGFPARVFPDDPAMNAGTHIAYNERIQSFESQRFNTAASKRILVVGESQARDFANILIEMGALDTAQLVYRKDLPLCEFGRLSTSDTALVREADVIFYPITSLPMACGTFLQPEHIGDAKIVFVGPKHFGHNLNAFIRVPRQERSQVRARILDKFMKANKSNVRTIPAARYIDLIGYASEDGRNIRLFNDSGHILSADRIHITKAGAQFYANAIKDHSSLGILQE